MQDVQARSRLCAPFTMARTDCRFTFQRRLVTLWAWLTLCPNCGPLPHNSQTLAISFNRSMISVLGMRSRARRPDFNGMSDLVFAPLGYIDDHAQARLEVRGQSFLIAFTDLGLVIQFHVDV